MNAAPKGNNTGPNRMPERPRKNVATPPPAALTAAKDTQVTFKAGDEKTAFQGVLSSFTRLTAVFEIYGGNPDLRTSEVLTDFQIRLHDRVIYAGKAVVQNLVSVSTKLTCEVALAETDWSMSVDEHFSGQPETIAAEFAAFFKEWQNLYNVSPEFKVVVVDIQTFLYNLQLWLNQVELQLRALPGDQTGAEQRVLKAIGKITTPVLNTMFEKFEGVAQHIHPDSHAAHSSFAKRNLHSLLLCSPFLYRTFTKPLGYAGDYEMVNMLNRNPFEGGSLFAKIVNLWFWEQPPAQAHRNRLAYLERRIGEETLRLMRRGRKVRVFNFACGPAVEIQEFLRHSQLASKVDFFLADFNQETLDYARRQFEAIQGFSGVKNAFKFQKKSVQQLLKDRDKVLASQDASLQYNMVYCAGLFDYLSDRTCKELMNAFYNFVAPGGVLIATNVNSSNPRRPTMDMIMEWHLIYRSAEEFVTLRPDDISVEDCSVVVDDTGVNIFLECRKPENG